MIGIQKWLATAQKKFACSTTSFKGRGLNESDYLGANGRRLVPVERRDFFLLAWS